MKAALIGRGYWGKILIPYIKSEFDLVSVTGKGDSDIKEISKNVDVFFIATPIGTHYRIVKKCIKQGRHVFCEKPLTISYKKALKLYNLSKKYGVKLYTDYTEMTASSRLEMLKLKGHIGEILRIKGFTTKCEKHPNHNLLWKLGCHQLSMLSLFVDLKELKFELTKSFSSIRKSCTIEFSGKVTGTLYMSMNAKIKEKIFCVHGVSGKLFYDYTDLYPVKVYQDNILKIRKKFDEKNNLYYSVKKFKEIIKKDIESNNIISIEITRIIENLLK